MRQILLVQLLSRWEDRFLLLSNPPPSQNPSLFIFNCGEIHLSYHLNHLSVQSVILNTFIMLCNHLHHQSLELFHLAKLKLCTY